MSIIDTQNEKQIRDPMDVHATLNYRMDPSVYDLTFSVLGQKAVDENVNVALDNDKWDMRTLADFQGSGFLLDGNAEFSDGTAGSLESGKIGVRTHIGGKTIIEVSAAHEIPGITITILDGEGTITANGIEYSASRMVVIPVNGTHIRLECQSTAADRRLEIASIIPGITLQIDNDNLISCSLSLRSNTSIVDSAWEVSEIEIQAYWPYDISEAVSNMGNDVPVVYYAGYGGDVSRPRYFYLSEKVAMQDHVITIKGEDASAKLDRQTVTSRLINTIAKSGRRQLYQDFFKDIITKSGIKIRYDESKEYAIGNSGTSTKAYSMQLASEQSAREHVANIMNLVRIKGTDEFWPSFVDAGYPCLTWRYPRADSCNRGYGQWTIKEEDCGDVVREADRNVSAIRSSLEDYGFDTSAVRDSKWRKLKESNVKKAGTPYSFQDEESFYYDFKVSNGYSLRKNADHKNHKATWKASHKTISYTRYNKKGTKKYITEASYKRLSSSSKKHYKRVTLYKNKTILYGKKVTLSPAVKRGDNYFYGAKTIVHPERRPGMTMETEPLVLGRVYSGSTWIFPDYRTLFNRSNITGSFTWKGDPRMQPRDIFNFIHKDGTSEICTIENITLTHEGGGTKAEITYRAGVC
ncbi:MAG: hypothetical protein ACOX4I_00645 [Anaerovoracaceae bacterium]|jgi:hypothetical protein